MKKQLILRTMLLVGLALAGLGVLSGCKVNKKKHYYGHTYGRR
ncbi:hypothetical protein [Treponema phagedenis]|uniref:Lipoprotein n=1 Tax=Treponema phagedenis TaxID=162 RepID=A0A0B7GVU1_TREPH|nr:hypothetical protein [Treponema phagedenis]CEM62804.1 exported hypothetical protein [Treponema phagedenis]